MKQFDNSSRQSRGFTLIELLVVVSIIAILSAIGLSTFVGAQKKARDARRRADLKAIQGAAEQYYINSATGVYPTTDAALDDNLEGNVVPTDPRSAASYIWVTRTASAYRVCADLEDDGTWTGAGQNVCEANLQ